MFKHPLLTLIPLHQIISEFTKVTKQYGNSTKQASLSVTNSPYFTSSASRYASLKTNFATVVLTIEISDELDNKH